MIEALCLFILGYVAAVFQSGAGAFFQIGLIRLDALPALICCYSLRQGLPYGALVITVFGLIVSCFSTMPAYVFPFSYIIGFLIVRYIVSNVLELANWQTYVLVGFLSMEIIVVQLAGSGNAELVWPWGLSQAVVNVVTAPVFIFFWNRLESVFRKLKGKKREISTSG